MVMRVFLALCGRLWAEQEQMLPLPSWQALPAVDRESISLAAILTAQEMMRLQREGEAPIVVVRTVLPRIWDEHYHRPPVGGMPLWEEMSVRQQDALTLIAQCLATECECAVMDAGEA